MSQTDPTALARGIGHRALLTLGVLAIVVFATGCASTYRMGDPLKSTANTAVRPTQAKLDPWEQKWGLIQSNSDKIDWVDHFRVCALKYRYRNYDELFRCLDLWEARLAGLQKTSYIDALRRAAPVLTGWMRASAYADLGEPEVALKWAQSAWSALPEDYRTTHQSFFGGQSRDDFTYVAEKISGFSVLVTDEARVGRDNPAGLDLSAENIAMSLASQRSLLYQHLGEPAKARSALAELLKWETLRKKDSFTGLIPTSAPYAAKAQLLSIGPLFAMGEYARAAQAYDATAAAQMRTRHREQFLDTAGWIFLFPWKVSGTFADSLFNAAFAPTDARLFAIAVEDASNALIYAQSLSRLGRTNEARSMLDTLLALPEIRSMGNLYWVALYERGLVAIRDRKPDEALRLLRGSVDAIEAVRSSISFEAAKIGFAGDKQAVYGALIGVLFDAQNWPEAFLIVERAKARALVDLLAQRHDLAFPPGADDKVRELFARAVTKDADLGLPSSADAVRGIKVVSDSRTNLAKLAPEAASLLSVQSVSMADVAAKLSSGETLIDYYRSGDVLFVIVLQGTEVAGFRISAAGLDEQVRSFRAAIEQRDARVTEIGRALYERIVRPLTADFKGNTLIISPNGVLHYLPFAALHDGDQYLLDRFSIRLIPSASTLVYLRGDHPAKAGRLLALGNPDLGNPRYDLANAQIEAVTVAGLFPDSRALVRGEASKSAFRELGGGFSILHFATHGKFDADAPLSSGLYLAKGTEPDGVLTVSDLYTLRLDADLVTLSACETGLGKVANGDDVIGLTRGFLYAGARSIVASLWEVDDAATEQLMVSFYRNLQEHDKREALRLAQIETRVHYPQPLYWAAFQLIGRAD